MTSLQMSRCHDKQGSDSHFNYDTVQFNINIQWPSIIDLKSSECRNQDQNLLVKSSIQATTMSTDSVLTMQMTHRIHTCILLPYQGVRIPTLKMNNIFYAMVTIKLADMKPPVSKHPIILLHKELLMSIQRCNQSIYIPLMLNPQ